MGWRFAPALGASLCRMVRALDLCHVSRVGNHTLTKGDTMRTAIELLRSDDVCMRRPNHGPEVEGYVTVSTETPDGEVMLSVTGGRSTRPTQRARVWLTLAQARKIGRALTEAANAKPLFWADGENWSVGETANGELRLRSITNGVALSEDETVALERAIGDCKCSIAARK